MGIENRLSDWAKVITKVQYALTQHRSDIKKAVLDSIKGTDPRTHENIFEFTTTLTKGTSLSVNVNMCAHVSILRFVIKKNKGQDYWDDVDDVLAQVRAKSAGNPAKYVKYFMKYLAEDRQLHGQNNYDIPDPVIGDWQRDIDEDVASSSITSLALTSVPATPAPSGAVTPAFSPAATTIDANTAATAATAPSAMATPVAHVTEATNGSGVFTF